MTAKDILAAQHHAIPHPAAFCYYPDDACDVVAKEWARFQRQLARDRTVAGNARWQRWQRLQAKPK
jgi:hypothetical protein